MRNVLSHTKEANPPLHIRVMTTKSNFLLSEWIGRENTNPKLILGCIQFAKKESVTFCEREDLVHFLPRGCQFVKVPRRSEQFDQLHMVVIHVRILPELKQKQEA